MKNLCVKCLCLFIVMGFAINGYAKEPLVPVTIQLNWVPNVEFAGILIAKEKGWYEEAGIDLIIRSWKPGISFIDEVVSGNAHIGVTEGADLIRARADKKMIKAISVHFQKPPGCLISKKEKGIDSPEKIKGKKVGINQDEVVMMKTVLANLGVSYEDITPVETESDVQSLVDDKIDVCVGYMNGEPLSMKEKGYEMNVIPLFKYGYDFYAGVVFATDRIIKENPKLIQKFMDVTLRGWKEAFKEPAATAKLVVEKFYPKGSVSQQTESLKIFKHLATIGIGESLVGYMEEQFWQKGIDIMYQFKQIEKKIPASDVFTLEFLKK